MLEDTEAEKLKQLNEMMNDSVVVDKKTMEYMMREYTEARSAINQDEGWISEEDMLRKHGVNL